METKFIEVTNDNANWGKFLILRFDKEFAQQSAMAPGHLLLAGRGWAPEHIIVFDLETCEGAGFRPGGSPFHDLRKHRVWVCPMFEPFLGWLYKQDLTDLQKLPATVNIPDAEFRMSGHRRPGLRDEKKAIPGGTYTVIDPETKEEIEVEAWKDPDTGAMFAIDSSWLERVEDGVISPFNPETFLRLKAEGE